MTRPQPASSEEAQRTALESAVRYAGLSLEQLWTRYFALGGDLDLIEVDAFLAGAMQVPRLQRDMLAHAVNERLDELFGQRRVPYTVTVRERRPATGPLAALVHLIDSAHEAPPERLPALVREAGRALGVELYIHLVDHEQRRLTRLEDGGELAGAGVAVQGTLPGRAYQTVRILPSEVEGRPRLWVPLLDGADRLGVLEVRVGSVAELHDPALRDQCWWVARLVGHLAASLGQYGDDLERARRERPRSPSAELLWQQMPPLTAATDAFTISGLIEPSYEAGGDAFDYALSQDAVSLALFDAMGHGMGAALMAAAALSGYRAARRDGRSLFDQARSIDDVVSGAFARSAFVTGVIAELDVRSGRLRYVSAGHPAPLLMRGGKVVKTLGGGRRVPFGLEAAGLTVAEEVLQPGDWLVLYTDGITEARDAAGAWFGEERLVDFLSRSAAAAHPPPETARRLTEAVLEHQDGRLQDDASILMACWREDAAG
jgi:serine phosphatase RsbU (regulator of sigma subunit)